MRRGRGVLGLLACGAAAFRPRAPRPRPDGLLLRALSRWAARHRPAGLGVACRPARGRPEGLPRRALRAPPGSQALACPKAPLDKIPHLRENIHNLV